MRPLLIEVKKDSELAADRRLFKLLRTMLLRKNYAESMCWRKKTKALYLHHYGLVLRTMKRHLLKNFPACATWELRVTGSTKMIDLEANRCLSFVVVLTMKKEDTIAA